MSKRLDRGTCASLTTYFSQNKDLNPGVNVLFFGLLTSVRGFNGYIYKESWDCRTLWLK